MNSAIYGSGYFVYDQYEVTCTGSKKVLWWREAEFEILGGRRTVTVSYTKLQLELLQDRLAVSLAASSLLGNKARRERLGNKLYEVSKGLGAIANG